MPRASTVTLAQVKEAMDVLRNSGRNPTAKAVLQHLGTGSMSTIHGHIITLRAEAENSAESPAAKEALAGVWEAAVSAATAVVKKQLAELREELSEAMATIKELEIAADKAEQERDAAIAQKDECMNALLQSRDDVKVARALAEQEAVAAKSAKHELSVLRETIATTKAEHMSELQRSKDETSSLKVQMSEAALQHSKELVAVEQKVLRFEGEKLSLAESLKLAESRVQFLASELQDERAKIAVLQSKIENDRTESRNREDALHRQLDDVRRDNRAEREKQHSAYIAKTESMSAEIRLLEAKLLKAETATRGDAQPHTPAAS